VGGVARLVDDAGDLHGVARVQVPHDFVGEGRGDLLDSHLLSPLRA